MSLVTWNPSYSVKVKACDDDHLKLFSIINKLHDAMKVGKGSQLIHDIVRELADYTKFHFTREEALLLKSNYAQLGPHRAQHSVFVDKIEQLQRELKEGKTGQSVEVAGFLRDWLVNHIQQTDKQYSAHLNAFGIS